MLGRVDLSKRRRPILDSDQDLRCLSFGLYLMNSVLHSKTKLYRLSEVFGVYLEYFLRCIRLYFFKVWGTKHGVALSDMHVLSVDLTTSIGERDRIDWSVPYLFMKSMVLSFWGYSLSLPTHFLLYCLMIYLRSP